MKRPPKKIRLGLLGASGRMGQEIQKLLKDEVYQKDFDLVYIAPRSNEESEFSFDKKNKPQVMIDFSLPQASLKMAKLCAKAKVPILIGTTGFSEAEKKELKKILRGRKHLISSNTSTGVALFHELLKKLAPLLPADYQVEMKEFHHIHKKDKPSGTAKSLKETFLKHSKRSELEIESIREGEIPGIHTFVVKGPSEQLEITHVAQDRSLFAHGALRLAKSLVKKKAPGDFFQSHGTFFSGGNILKS